MPTTAVRGASSSASKHRSLHSRTQCKQCPVSDRFSPTVLGTQNKHTHTHSHTRTQAKLNAHRKFVWHTRRVDAQKPNKKALATSREWLLGSLSAWNCLPSPISIASQIYQFEVSATRKVGEENFMNYSTTLGAAQRKAGMQNRPETGWAQRARPVPVASFRATFHVLRCLRLLRKSGKSRHTHSERKRERDRAQKFATPGKSF